MQPQKNYFYFRIKIILIALAFLFNYPVYAAGSDSDNSGANISKSSYYYDALKLIKNKSFKLAIENLNKAEKNSKVDPDIYNYLGFSYRKMGNMKLASFNYEKALNIDPKHKGALEYQGEMFITLGQLDKAKANLKKLNSICFLACSEKTKLKNSIEKSQKGIKNNY
ncbi:tetratricopeptide repeat protein [Alphaproteobacteria bacterium]|nr:tetratricopeptide repeat protein [Alphaproteobacteria bacterium]